MYPGYESEFVLTENKATGASVYETYPVGVVAADNIAFTNSVLPSFAVNEKAITLQSYENAGKLWQAVSISATQIATNSWLSIVPDAANLDYTSVARISTNNTANTLLGFTLMTNAVIGTEYTYQGYAMAEAATTLKMGITPGYATNVVWQTSTAIGTTPTFFKISVVAVHTNAIRCFRIDANAGTDFLIVSNVTYSVGGYFPVDGVRVFPSALDATKGWRYVGPNSYSTKAITAASDWIYADADTIVLIPTGAVDLTTSLPTLIPGTINQIVEITSSSADAVTFNDNGSVAGTLLELGAATRAVATNDVLRLKYNGTSWVEAGFFNN